MTQETRSTLSMTVAGFGMIFAAFGLVSMVIWLIGTQSPTGVRFASVAPVGLGGLILGGLLIGAGIAIARSNRESDRSQI